MVLRLLHAPSGQKDGDLIKAPQQKHFQRESTRRISNTFFCDEFFLKTPCSLHDGNGMSGLDWASNLQTADVGSDESHQICEEDISLKTLQASAQCFLRR